MREFWKRRSRGDELETRLRDERPAAPQSLVNAITGRLEQSRRRSPRVLSRLAFAAAFTTFVFGGFVSAGGAGYASATVEEAADTVRQVVARAPLVREATSAAAQYEEEEVLPEEEEIVQPPPADVLFEEEELEVLPVTGATLAPIALVGLGFLVLGLFFRRIERRPE